MSVIDILVPKLVELPGTLAVVLGGSRARGTHRPDSDWDIGVYYRGTFDASALLELGHPGHAVQPGEWGRIVNGGAWLSVDGEPVDVLLRDLDRIERWWSDAREGRFDIDQVEGHVAGLPTYVPVGEVAIAQVLHGRLPTVDFPLALRESASARWGWNAAFSLLFAGSYADSGDITLCVGMLARAATQTAHGVLAARGEWALGEKRLLAAAGLEQAHDIVASAGHDATAAVSAMRTLLDPPRLDELSVHDVS